MEQEEIGEFLINAVCNIFKGNTYDLSFDEIYWMVFSNFTKFGYDFFMKAISSGLRFSLEEDRVNLFNQDGEDFNQFLINLSRRVFQSLNQIKAAFKPMYKAESGDICDNEIIKAYREIIFMDEENSNKINNFLIRYAHNLPGSFDIENEMPMIKLLQQVLYPSPLWNLFVDHLCESTDAYCLYVSSTLLSQDPCQTNPISYLSAVLDFFSHEENLWKLLPNQDHERLHHLATTCLIYDIKDEYLFSDENKSLISRAFYDDLKNLDIFKKILNLFANDNSIITEFVLVLFEHFKTIIDNLASEPANSLQASSVVTETIINTFEKIQILQTETVLGNSPIFQDTFEVFKRNVLSKDNLNFESNAAKAIGMKISNVCSDPSKEPDLIYFVHKVGELILYSDNKLLFIESHNSLMFGRLCMYAGKQYKLEHNVLKVLEPFVPPSLSDPFQEKLKAFEESEEVNKQWSAKPFGKNLSVFILSSTKAPNLVTKFGNLILPPELKKWQDNFTQFFQSSKKGHVNINYIYEDNLVEMNVRFPKCANQFTLKSPLIFTVVFHFISFNPGATFDEISRSTGLRPKDVESVVAKGANSKEFLIFKVIKNPQLEQTRVFFNMDFSSNKLRFNVMLPNRFKLNLDTAEMMKSKRLKLYQSQIAKVVKENGRVNCNDLNQLVASTLPQGIQFKQDEFAESLASLIDKGYLIIRGRFYQYLDE